MLILKIALIIFMFLEFTNVLALYSKLDFEYGNSVGVLNAWNKSIYN